jgi:hypothetical protein
MRKYAFRTMRSTQPVMISGPSWPLGVSVVGKPAVGSAADGRLEIFVRGGDDHQWDLYQTSPNGDWSDWEDLSVYRPLSVTIAGEPGVGPARRCAGG